MTSWLYERKPKRDKMYSRRIWSSKKIFSDKCVKLSSLPTKKKYVMWAFSKEDLKYLYNWESCIPIYIPVQWFIGSKYEWEIKYIKAYVTKGDVLDYFWFPHSMQRRIIRGDVRYADLEQIIFTVDRKKNEFANLEDREIDKKERARAYQKEYYQRVIKPKKDAYRLTHPAKKSGRKKKVKISKNINEFMSNL